jgi:hypothetical protein
MTSGEHLIERERQASRLNYPPAITTFFAHLGLPVQVRQAVNP